MTEIDHDPDRGQRDEMIADAELARPLVRIHPRRRWPWIAAVAAVVVAGGSIAALTLTSSQPAPSAACRHAVAVQNDYVDEQVALGYPDAMGIDQAMTVMTADIGLLNNLSKAKCPGNTLVHVLPSGN